MGTWTREDEGEKRWEVVERERERGRRERLGMKRVKERHGGDTDKKRKKDKVMREKAREEENDSEVSKAYPLLLQAEAKWWQWYAFCL